MTTALPVTSPDEAEVSVAIARLLDALGLSHKHSAHMHKTPERIAKLFCREVLRGLYEPCPTITDFPNIANLDQLYSVGPVAVRSLCAHHFAPIEGQAWVTILPHDRVIGLSKFSRVTSWVMARPQVQEEATAQLADVIEAATKPLGLGVVVRARHLCMTWRGVMEHETQMVTSIVRGALRDSPALKEEMFSLIRAQGF
jgi:GTP cyclohydrolase I